MAAGARTMGRSARLRMVAVTLAAVAAIATPAAVTAQGEADADGLVTEVVEPGVVRIIRDDAGHDLDERHPTYRYDMDDIFVAPDGTVWLTSSYRESDNDVNPPGALVWALGQPGTPQYTPPAQFCFPGDRGLGVDCYDFATDTVKRGAYLARTGINAVAMAPDGTFWAVGADGGSNGGLYHITPE